MSAEASSIRQDPTDNNNTTTTTTTTATATANNPEPHLHLDKGDISEKPASLNTAPDDSTTIRNNDSAGRVNGAKTASKKSSVLPDWVTEHLTLRDFKILIRCSIAGWASFLFVVINPVLQNFGQAAFMGMLCLFINPPSTILPLYLLAATTILLGICLAWGWGTLASLAAMSRRDDDLYNARYNAIRQAAAGTPNPRFYVQRQIFNGELLEAGPTITLLAMCLVFVYFMARIQASFPKLTLVSIFGIIVIDPYITTAPLLNNFNGTLPLIFVKPLASAVGIGVVLSIFCFPESCSHATLALLTKSIGRVREALDITKATLEDLERDIAVGDIKKLKEKIIEERTEIDLGFTFMGLEFSLGRWSGEDVRSLKDIFQDLYIRTNVLLNFHLLRQEYRSKILHRSPKADYPADDDSDSRLDKSQEHLESNKREKHPRRAGASQTLATLTVYEFLRPEPEIVKLGQDALKAVEDVSCSLFTACDDALSTSSEIMTSVNSTRWFGSPKKSEIDALVEKHTRVLDKLKHERDYFARHAVDRVVEPISQFFDKEGKLVEATEREKSVRLPGLMIGINYRHRILSMASVLVDLLEKLIDLEMKRTRVRLWMPFAFTGLFSWALSPEPVRDDNALERTETRQEKEGGKVKQLKAKKNKKAKSKEAVQPRQTVRRQRSRFAQALTGVFHWLTNNEGVFAARVVIVTLIMAIPGILRPTAEFCYDNRSIWALIMAQLTISQYLGDFVFSVAMRTFGTVVGGICGLIVWYIGAGSGPGNPYGIMAILAPFVVIGITIRVFAPREWMMPGVMGVATLMLVIGYSWEVHYLPQLIHAEPGYGVLYRRLLLVMVGFAAAIIVQIFPRPPSATRNAAKSLATVLSELTQFYSDTMSDFLSAPDDQEFSAEEVKERVAELYFSMQELIPRIKMVKFEPSSSPFTSENLMDIADYLGKILESLSIMSLLAPRLSPMYKRRLEVQTDFARTETVASIMAILGVLEGSLRTGYPLAEILPVPLLGRLRKLGGPADGVDSLTIDMLKDEEWTTFVVMMMSITSLYSRIDDLVMHIKGAVGEKYFVTGLPHHSHRHHHNHPHEQASAEENSSINV
ncbi:hypothetical protein TWF569_003185 [Orbilia oligospora]|uniref:ER transporter 6TM N-terminal domain-containing protein n=1 Tax=Orbilia oligospora TaxID=2813651 RepID=A0A7C8J6W9_ORBOL|nr:hypothetical protein TWF102_005971 [Orbilia oligospora]KAF3108198.1 hypothetical protein TWF103_005743 [Orbilia oligospora]KAF3124537.1 hypothetical protein TWF703_011290 [Orbilia oligospora]KAF3152141.1 hypothetical protein TWF569_003185 [Orbilia oligospora]